MKIILTQEVSGLGTPGDIVEVKDGYGRNYLLPQGFAIPWTKGAREAGRGHQAGPCGPRDPRPGPRQRGQGASWRASRSTLAVRAGDGGRLFGSVTPAEVVDAVKAAGGPALDRRRLELPGHIKSIGDYQVQVKLHPEVTASFTLNVTAAK